MILIVTKKKLIRGACFLLFLCVFAKYGIGIIKEKTTAVGAIEGNKKAYVAIVIDDFGYDGEGTEEMLALNIPITAAVMPFSPHSSSDCEAIRTAGKEMIIHMPMESLTGKKSWVGDKAVFSSMTDEEIKQTILEAMEIVPDATGINNHMGSKIMEDERSLNVVMSMAAEKGLIFVDSRTTPKSLAEQASTKYSVPLLERDVFLDSTDDINVVKKKLIQTADIALKTGSALAIGHVGPEGGKITAKAIADLAPELQKKGIEFVTISQLEEILKAQEQAKSEIEE